MSSVSCVKSVRCSECQKFNPSRWNPKYGSGICGELLDYMKKIGRPMRNTECDAVDKSLGIVTALGQVRLTYPGVERNCSKYEGL